MTSSNIPNNLGQAFVLVLILAWTPENCDGQIAANLIGGHLNWTVNSNFGNPTNPVRTVSFTLTSLFTQHSSCTYSQGRVVDCSGVAAPAGCGAACEIAKVASVHGMLCIAQLQHCSTRNLNSKCTNYIVKYWPEGQDAFHCLSDVNRGTRNVTLDQLGRTNAFTVQAVYDGTCQSDRGDRSRFKLSCGTNAVLGALQHTVRVDNDVVGLVAWLAPYGTAGSKVLPENGLLMTPCSQSVQNSPCIVNLDQIGRMTSSDSSASFIAAEFDDGTANANELYWKSWSSVTAITDSMSWVERGSTGQSYPSCKVKVGCLALASPALETFVPLCARSLDYSDPIVHGTVGDGSYPSSKFCANQPLRNYYSPVAQAPLAFSVPITPATFRPGAALPRHPYFNLHSSDMDGHQMQQRLPVRRTSAAGTNLNLGTFCLQWVAQADGSRRLTQMEAGKCKPFFDLDRDASRAQGNWVVLNISETASANAASGTDAYAPLWTQTLRRKERDPTTFSCTSTTGCVFGSTACTSVSGCNDDTAQMFAQHWVTTVDMMYEDVDNPPGMGLPHIRTIASWGGEGPTTVQTVFATFPRFAGTANQPPAFVTGQFSSDTNVSTVYTCLIGTKCVVPLFINDFAISAAGVVADPPAPSGHALGVEMAVGFPTVSGALGDDGPCSRAAAVDAGAAATNGALSCPFRLGAASAPFFGDGDIGQAFVRCFVAYDTHPDTAKPLAVSSQSLPHCVKIVLQGPPPAFVAPTPGFDAAGLPLPAASLDDNGLPVAGRADVAACEGFPAQLTLAARSPNPADQVRIFVQDWDVDASLYPAGAGTRALRDPGGRGNPDFLSSAPLPSGGPCGGFAGFGAVRVGDNAAQTAVQAQPCEIPDRQLPQSCAWRSVAGGYGNVSFAAPGATATLSVAFTPRAGLRNGLVVQDPDACAATPDNPTCRQKRLNMDQVICGAAYSNTRRRLARWVGERNPNGPDLPAWRRDHSNGDLASDVFCWRVRLQAPPVFTTDVSGASTPFAEKMWKNITDPTGDERAYRHVPVRFNETVRITFVAQDPNPGDTVTLLLLETPGMPAGLVSSGSRCVPPDPNQPSCQASDLLPAGWPNVPQQITYASANSTSSGSCNRARLTLTWSPTPASIGASARVCVAARDDSTACFGQGPQRATKQGWWGEQQCVVLDVLGTDFLWEAQVTEGAAATAYVGCTARIEAAVTGRGPGGGPGAYDVLLELDDAPPPPGAPPAPASGLTTAALPANGTRARLQVGWRPARGMEGSRVSVCVAARDRLRLFASRAWCDAPGQPAHGAGCDSDAQCGSGGRCRRACVVVAVERCQVCVGGGDTLAFLARQYAVQTTWLRLWALNSDPMRGGGGAVVRDPDVLVASCPPGGADGVGGCEARVVVGPVYETGTGDALAGVAARYRTTVKTLLMMNADLLARLPDLPAPDTPLPPGTPLCVLPCTA